VKKLVISLLTMNVAGIPLVHPHWTPRRAELGRDLRAGNYDVVAMQEVWMDGDASELSETSGLPYFARFQRQIDFGTGLAVLSRWPVLEQKQIWFTCRPSKLRSYDGEAIANKGALLVRLQTPSGPLDVYDTHLIAEYRIARYRTLRLTQVFELAEFIAENSTAAPFVLVGDLNASRDDEAYGVLRDLLGLDDPCEKKGKEACGATVSEDWSGAKKIDHVLLPRGGKGAAGVAEFAPLADGEPLSDHKAVAAKIEAASLRPPRYDRTKRLAALARVDAAIAGMADAMARRRARRSWIPVYGFLLSARYTHQLEQLYSLRARIETARLLTR
jgi:sphingomyelin phosphodiesterase 2